MLEAFRNNLLWLIFGTSLSVGFGLLIAVLADRSRYENVYKAIIFMPMAISFVGAGVIWKFIYSYQGNGIRDPGNRPAERDRAGLWRYSPTLAANSTME